jgi:hypothetical protein
VIYTNSEKGLPIAGILLIGIISFKAFSIFFQTPLRKKTEKNQKMKKKHLFSIDLVSGL